MIKYISVVLLIGVLIGRITYKHDCDKKEVIIIKVDNLYRSDKKYFSHAYNEKESCELFQERSWR